MTTVKGENRYSFLATDTETEELVEINENGEVIDEFWYDEGTITYMRRRLKEYRKRLGIKKFARVNIDNFFD